MIPDQFGHYYPDLNVPENSLNDSFFQTLNLLNQTFDEAMKLVEKIYDEANQKRSQYQNLCQCLNAYFNEPEYLVYFKNPKSQDGFVSIFTQFIDAYRGYMYSEEEILDRFYYNSDMKLTTLVRFCIRNEFTDYRENFYNKVGV